MQKCAVPESFLCDQTGCLLLALSGALTNVCFEGKNGHGANGPSCPLLTHSGHCVVLGMAFR